MVEPHRDTDPGDPLKCSFCDKTQKEVRNLIAGPNVYICNECVAVSLHVLAEGEGQAAAEATALVMLQPDQLVHCALCRGDGPVSSFWSVRDIGLLCPQCTERIRSSLPPGGPGF